MKRAISMGFTRCALTISTNACYVLKAPAQRSHAKYRRHMCETERNKSPSTRQVTTKSECQTGIKLNKVIVSVPHKHSTVPHATHPQSQCQMRADNVATTSPFKTCKLNHSPSPSAKQALSTINSTVCLSHSPSPSAKPRLAPAEGQQARRAHWVS